MSIANPEIFKAYDIRGLYGERHRRRRCAEQIGRAFARVIAELEGKPTAELRLGLGRDMRLTAPELAAALPRGHGQRGRHRARRRPGRHRDALLPRRLARPRRRADVHRLAQPQGLHRAPSSSSAARSRCRATRASATSATRSRTGLGDAPGRRLGRGGRDLRRVPGGRAQVHRPRRGQAAEGRRRRRQRHGRPDGRAAARAPRPRPRRGLLDARRQLPRPRAQPAAAREPRVHHARGRRARAPTSASPGTATPTAASSSTTRARSSTATS